MTPQTLDALRDIHLPPPVSWWPPAPGWWILAVLLLLAAFGLWKKWRIRREKRAVSSWQQTARDELERIRRQYMQVPDNERLGGELSALLRRVALRLAERPESVASLTGTRWLAWLDEQWERNDFQNGQGRILIELPYRPMNDEAAAKALLQLVDEWLQAVSSKEVGHV